MSAPQMYEDLILDQRALDLPYGLRGTAAIGCGWVAVYNALLVLGIPADMDEVRKDMEKLLIFGGFNGTPFYALALYLRHKGLRVRICCNRIQLARRAYKAPAGILFYLYNGGRIFPCGHFTTIHPTKDGRLHFYNDFPGKADDLRSIHHFRKDRSPYFMLLIELYK